MPLVTDAWSGWRRIEHCEKFKIGGVIKNKGLFPLPDYQVFSCNFPVVVQVNFSDLQFPSAAFSTNYLRPVNMNLNINQNCLDQAC